MNIIEKIISLISIILIVFSVIKLFELDESTQKIQVKRKQRNTLRKSTIKPINKKTRGRRNKKKKRSVTFKL